MIIIIITNIVINTIGKCTLGKILSLRGQNLRGRLSLWVQLKHSELEDCHNINDDDDPYFQLLGQGISFTIFALFSLSFLLLYFIVNLFIF